MTTNRKSKDSVKKPVDTLHVVHGIVRLAREQKVQRIKVGDIEIDFHPDAFKMPIVEKPKTAMQMKLEAEKRAKEQEEIVYYSAD